MVKGIFDLKDPTGLAHMAMKIEPEELASLVKNAAQLLAKENDKVGILRIVGRLVMVPPEGEAIVVGDVHGDLESLKHILKDSNFVEHAEAGEDVLLIFLGDYGDRGIHSLEVYYVVLKLKQMFPERVVLLRGNHEGPDDLLASPHDLPIHLSRELG